MALACSVVAVATVLPSAWNLVVRTLILRLHAGMPRYLLSGVLPPVLVGLFYLAATGLFLSARRPVKEQRAWAASWIAVAVLALIAYVGAAVGDTYRIYTIMVAHGRPVAWSKTVVQWAAVTAAILQLGLLFGATEFLRRWGRAFGRQKLVMVSVAALFLGAAWLLSDDVLLRTEWGVWIWAALPFRRGGIITGAYGGLLPLVWATLAVLALLPPPRKPSQ
jgi:hypothetical protein